MRHPKWLRSFLFIWAGQFISTITSYGVNFAIVIWLSLEYQSAEILAFAGIASLLPQAVIGPFVGVYIDRWDRKKVMIFADAFIALCAFAMTFVIKEHGANLFWAYVLLGCRSVGSAFHAPAMQAVAPLIVPEKELLRVSGVNQMIQSVSSIAGPALGTLAITYLHASNVLYLDVVGAVAAIISLLFVSIPHVKKPATSSVSTVVTELRHGFDAIHFNRGLRMLFLYAMITMFFYMPVSIMFPLLTLGHYGGGKWEMSIIEIVWGIGMLVGGSALGILRVKTSKVILVNSMHIILGVTFVLSGLFPASWFVGFVLMTMSGGIAVSIFSAAFMTIIQVEVASHLLGRVFSLYYSVSLLPSLIGLLFTGLVAEIIGVADAFLISGAMLMLVGIASFLTPALMHLGRKRVSVDSAEEV